MPNSRGTRQGFIWCALGKREAPYSKGTNMAKAQTKSAPTADNVIDDSSGHLDHRSGCSCSQCDCKHCGGEHREDSTGVNDQAVGIARVDLRHIVKMNEQRHLGVLSTHDLDVSVVCIQPRKVSNASAHNGDRVYIVERGEGRVQIDLAWTSIEKGDLFVVPADSAFALSAYSDRDLKLVVVAASNT